MATTIHYDHWDEMRDVFRQDVLREMDAVMQRLTAHCPALNFPDNCAGARDGDLPELFRAIDAQFERNMIHGNVWRGEEPKEYEILLSAGGPALHLVGDLDGGEPCEEPRLQWQDWGTPWTDLDLDGNDRRALRIFASVFYFGEG